MLIIRKSLSLSCVDLVISLLLYASEMTYIVSGGALNSHSLTHVIWT